jgi:UDP-3-O-[3-hydroxymyristoyl] glucosamine N-acyltransferase
MSKNITLSALAELVGGEISGDSGVTIKGFAPLDAAGEGEISFLAKANRKDLLEDNTATAVIVPQAMECGEGNFLRVKDPYLASAIIHSHLLDEPKIFKGVHERAVIGDETTLPENITVGACAVIGDRVVIGERVVIGPGTVVGDDVTIGDDTVLKSNVTIEDGCCLGARVVLHPGVVVGADGYGYAADQTGCHVKRPQVGIVEIEDDVEIGANSCIDRATFGVTLIKSGTKIDNLVQVAHNVIVGENSLLVAQVGIAGSTTLGRNVVMGGKASVKGHVKLGDGVMVAAKGGVHNNLSKGEVVAGSPAIPIKQWVKAATVYAKLPDVWKDLKKIRNDIKELQEKK